MTPELTIKLSNSREYTLQDVITLIDSYGKDTNKDPKYVDQLIKILPQNSMLLEQAISKTLEYFRRKFNVITLNFPKGGVYYYV